MTSLRLGILFSTSGDCGVLGRDCRDGASPRWRSRSPICSPILWRRCSIREYASDEFKQEGDLVNTKLLKTAAMALALSVGLATFARADDTATQGGTIVVTYRDDIATLVPAIGYDWQNWSMINSLFSRLVDYKFGTTEIVPSLADSWTISPDGLVYTFKLNPKAKFTNGRKVSAADIKYSIERSVNPKTQGPAGGFFHSIVGQDKMADGSATTISGIETPDDSTVKFTLTEPG